ncbi:MAG TPA: hypothetical protein VKP66_03165 [Steroidobacteraceae bacterium]|nr:hypothetical protein [Steroidobacteraceae bacterium]
MLEALDPGSTSLAKPFVASLNLSDDAMAHLDSRANVRRYLDSLLAAGLAGDVLVIIARALPAGLAVAWCSECVRGGLEGSGAAVEAERAAVALAQQCQQEPNDEIRQLCLEFAERAQRRTAGAWLVTAAAWADGHLSPPGAATKIPAPPEAVAAAVVAALKLAAARAGTEEAARLNTYAKRALALFGPRAASR